MMQVGDVGKLGEFVLIERRDALQLRINGSQVLGGTLESRGIAVEHQPGKAGEMLMFLLVARRHYCRSPNTVPDPRWYSEQGLWNKGLYHGLGFLFGRIALIP